MSILGKLTQLIDSIDDFNAAIIAKLASVRNSAVSVSSSDLLNGKTASEIINDATATQVTHVGRKDNPHAITAETIGGMQKSLLDAIAANRIPTKMSGLSFVSGPSYLQPYAHDEEVATNLAKYPNFQFVVEDDGMAVMLRNAVVDGVPGVYYSYALNAMGGLMGSIIHTSVRLHIPMLGSRVIGSIVASGAGPNGVGAFVVRMVDSSGVETSELALVQMTQRTLSPDTLTCYKMPSGILNLTNYAANKITSIGNRICVFVMTEVADLPVGYLKCYISGVLPAADYSATVPFTPFGTTSLNRAGYGTTVPSTDGGYALFDMLRSTEISDAPLFLASNGTDIEIPGGLASVSISVVNVGVSVKMLFHVPARFSVAGQLTATWEGQVSFGLDINTTTRAASLVMIDQLPINVSFNGLFTVNGIEGFTSKPTRHTDMTLFDKKVCHWAQRQHVFGVVTSTGESSGAVCIGTRHKNNSGVTDILSLLAVDTPTYKPFSASARYNIPNAIGQQPQIVAFTPGSLLVRSLNGNGGYSLSTIPVDYDATASHDTIEFGTIDGFQNSPARAIIVDPYKSVVASCINDQVTHAIASRFVSGLTDVRRQLLDANGAEAGATVTLSYENQQALAEEISTLLADTDFYFEFYLDFVVPDVAGMPCFGLLLSVDSINNATRVTPFTCDVNTRVGEITSWSDIKFGDSTRIANMYVNPQNPFVSLGGIAKSGIYAPVTTWETADSYCVDYHHAINPSNDVGARTVYKPFIIAKTTGNITTEAAVDMAAVGTNVATSVRMAVPGKGYGHVVNATKNTMAVLSKVGDTTGDFFSDSTIEDIYITGQVSDRGTLVYLSEPMPVFLGGVSGYTPATAIDFTSAVDGIHYLYLNVASGVFSYEVSSEKLEPTLTKMYIGTITIASGELDSSSLSRVYRIGRFNISPTAEHFSIPVSLGYHDEVQPLNWS